MKVIEAQTIRRVGLDVLTMTRLVWGEKYLDCEVTISDRVPPSEEKLQDVLEMEPPTLAQNPLHRKLTF